MYITGIVYSMIPGGWYDYFLPKGHHLSVAQKRLAQVVASRFSVEVTRRPVVESIAAGCLMRVKASKKTNMSRDCLFYPQDFLWIIYPRVDCIHFLSKHLLPPFSRVHPAKICKNMQKSETARQMECLRPGAWLNDEVINFYYKLLQANLLLMS